MLRVLVLIDHARGTSGPHRNAVGSLNALSRREDLQLRLLCRDTDPEEPYAQSKGIEIRRGYDPHSLSRFAPNVHSILSAARGCDVIYVPSGLKSLLFAQVARHGKRLVAGPNVSHLPGRKQDSPGKFELRVLCDCWIEASRARALHVIKCTGDTDVRVVHHGIDTAKWSPHRRNPITWTRFGVPIEGLKLLYVGRDNEPLKGVSQLLDAFALIQQGAKKDAIQLVLAGRLSASTLARLAKIGSAYPLGFVGSDVLPDLYASSDISVVPSSWENFPFTVLEALASGVAVVASNTGGIPEQIVDNRSGRLVEIAGNGGFRADAPGRLATAILELAENRELRVRLGAGGRERVLRHFSEGRLGQDLVDAFLGRTRPGAEGSPIS